MIGLGNQVVFSRKSFKILLPIFIYAFFSKWIDGLVVASSRSTCPSSCNNGLRCNDDDCLNCEFTCSGTCNVTKNKRCWHECNPSRCRWNRCSDCTFCIIDKSECLIAYFVDVTQYKLPEEDSYWHQLKHSGRPYNNEGSPLFLDLNGDNNIDFFNSMHSHPIDENEYDRMELGESVPYDFSFDGIRVSEDNSNLNITRFRPISYRIDINDKIIQKLDPHGQNVLDLDGDGFMDIMIATGGSKGKKLYPMGELSSDNFLLWGEEGTDKVTGERVTIFRGGRDTARTAGVNMRNGRGRINYMLDINGDGLIDIFCVQDRRETNVIAPGVLLVNQGNRTWKKDRKFSEYTRSMILTDADGDGLAQEIVLSRGFCFPQRYGPGTDPSKPEMGSFSNKVVEFCSTRPVGTMAVYKYDILSKGIEEISRKYYNVSQNNDMQPSCCPHGSFSGANDCHAKSMASGDFDGDLLADQVILYESKMVFYFSTDRPTGALPTDPSYIGAVISTPCLSESIRVIDLNNDGIEEILVMCRQAANFLVYTKGKSKSDWTLNNGCNHKNSIGALVDYNLTSFSEKDLSEICNGKISEWSQLRKACLEWEDDNKMPSVVPAGISTVDLNNDGFIDAVVTYNIGYTRYFHNIPSKHSTLNNYIIFQIVGLGIRNNKYGIGATCLLYTERSDGEVTTQFREVSSYQHTTDKYGNKEDRLIFGLGTDRKPLKLLVRWPNGDEQVKLLSMWEFSRYMRPIKIIEGMSSQPFPSTSPNIRCKETSGNKFLWYIEKQSDGKVVTKNCSWLLSRPNEQKTAICQKNYSTEKFKPANDVCPITCGLCKENNKSLMPTTLFLKEDLKFVWYVKNVKGNDIPVVKNCFWLSRRSPSQIKKICIWNRPINGIETAKKVCPIICKSNLYRQHNIMSTDICTDSNSEEFHWYTHNFGGKKTVITKDCDWLSKRSDQTQKKRICTNTISSGDYKPARFVCPMTCGICIIIQ